MNTIRSSAEAAVPLTLPVADVEGLKAPPTRSETSPATISSGFGAAAQVRTDMLSPQAAWVPLQTLGLGNTDSRMQASPLDNPVPAPSLDTLHSDPNARITLGMQGDAVKQIQAMLNVQQTGLFGETTQAAVVNFQTLYNLHPPAGQEGQVGGMTLRYLETLAKGGTLPAPSVAALRADPDVRLSIGMQGDAVTQLQALLKVPQTGTFDVATRNAVINFQNSHGLKPPAGQEGSVGRTTLGFLEESANVSTDLDSQLQSVDPTQGGLIGAALGHSEGTLNADGTKTQAYFGHTDPGDGRWNVGAFSYNGIRNGLGHDVTAAEADQIQLKTLRDFTPRVKQMLADAGLSPSNKNYNYVAACCYDLLNQAPACFTGTHSFANELKQVVQDINAGKDVSQAVAQGRVRSFYDDAGVLRHFSHSPEGALQDQKRRTDAIFDVFTRFNGFTGSTDTRGPGGNLSVADLINGKMINPGDTGDAVKYVQKALGLLQTGTFDKTTTAAVIAFKESHGLKTPSNLNPAAVGLTTLKELAKMPGADPLPGSPNAGVSRMLSEAASHIGFHEGPDNDNPFSHYFGRPSEAWCADFVSYCANKAGFTWMNTAAAQGVEDILQNRGQWKGMSNPQPGDAVTFRYNGDWVDDHVGMVEKVWKDQAGQTWIGTIEGNSSDQVIRHTYRADDPSIHGFGRIA